MKSLNAKNNKPFCLVHCHSLSFLALAICYTKVVFNPLSSVYYFFTDKLLFIYTEMLHPLISLIYCSIRIVYYTLCIIVQFYVVSYSCQ